MSKADTDDVGRHDSEDDPSERGGAPRSEPADSHAQLDYQSVYSEDSFWRKVTAFAGRAGKKVIRPALVLYFCLRDRNTPTWVKASILGALGYFILPSDAIPDAIPFGGFSDDFVVLAAALAYLGTNIHPEHKQNAESKLSTWFR